MQSSLVLIALISIAITFLATPFVIKIANKFGFLDNPKTRPHPAHTHKGVIPRAGGIALVLGIFLPILLFIPITKTFLAIMTSCIILVCVGLWDDRKNRSPYIRFLINVFVTLLVIGVGVKIPYITNPLGGVITFSHWEIIANLLSFIWILWTMNIIGWSGGVDGQLPGFVAIASLVIGLLSLRFASLDANQLLVTFLSFTTFGAFLGFLPWNFYPQKIMPGYGGKTLAGFILAVLSILSFSKLGTAILVLAVPMTDAAFILFRRILSRKSVVLASSGHLHHHLLLHGWGRRRIALFYWLISTFAGIIALLLNSKQKIFAIITIVVCILGFLVWVNFIKKHPINREIEEY